MTKRPLLMIHGYNHRPDHPKHGPHRPGGNFDIWPQIFTDHAPLFLEWDSALQGRDLWRAMRNGCWNTYNFAYSRLAPAAVEQANDMVAPVDGPIDIVAHSLGTRVALLLLTLRPHKFDRVLLMNGAETVYIANRIIRNYPDIRFKNVAVRTDDVVAGLGAWFEPRPGRHPCIGNGIGGRLPLDNLNEVILDDPVQKDYYHRNYGWRIDGDNPDSRGDHSYSFLNKNNWPLLRALLADDL